MQVAIELTEGSSGRVRARAKRWGLAPEKLASAAVAELLSEPESDFERTAEGSEHRNGFPRTTGDIVQAGLKQADVRAIKPLRQSRTHHAGRRVRLSGTDG